MLLEEAIKSYWQYNSSATIAINVKADGLQKLLEKEKEAISDLATVGIYLFSRGKDFIAGALDIIVNNDRVNNEFYTCPVYNYSIRNGKKIGVYEIEEKEMHGLGTPEDLQSYLASRALV